MIAFRYITIVIALGVNLSSCSQGNDRKSNTDCSEFSRQASENLNDYLYKSKNKKKLIESLSFYDSAINCDSLNSLNYQSKITVLGLLNRHTEIIGLLEKLFALSNETDVNVIVSKGIVYEKLGKVDSSSLEFKRAYDIYDRLLKQDRPDSLRIICEQIYLIAIVESKESALEKFEPYLIRYSQDPTVKLYERVLKDFDRNTILSEY